MKKTIVIKGALIAGVAVAGVLLSIGLAAYAGCNPTIDDPKCSSEEVRVCTGDVPPSAGGVVGEATCEGFTFSLTNVSKAVESWCKVLRWSGDGACMPDEVLETGEDQISPSIKWKATTGEESYSGDGAFASIPCGTNASAGCTFTLSATMPLCGQTLGASYSGDATFHNDVTISGGGPICCTSSMHSNHMFRVHAECGSILRFEVDAAAIAQQNDDTVWLQGVEPREGASITAYARGGEATAYFDVADVGDLHIGGCGCFSDTANPFETMGSVGGATQDIIPSKYEGSTRIAENSVIGWFDCNGNGEPDGDEPQVVHQVILASLGNLVVSSEAGAGSEDEEGYAPGSAVVFSNKDGLPADRAHMLVVVDAKAKDKNLEMPEVSLASTGFNEWKMTIPEECPEGTITVELTDPMHSCCAISNTITVAGCRCTTCDSAGDNENAIGSVDISFGLGRTKTGGSKSRLSFVLEDTSVLPNVAPQTFPDGRLDVETTNGTMRLSFTRVGEESAFAQYEMIPGATQFALVESRNGTPRRRTVWTKGGDEWTMEVYDLTVTPMELVERRTRRDVRSSSGTIVSETRGGIATEREYRNLASGGGFIVRETIGTGASAQTTWHAPVESGAAAGRTLSTVRPDGSWILYAYDANGRVASETEPFGDTTPILDARKAVIGYNGVVRETLYSYSPVDSRDNGSLSPYAARATVVRVGSDAQGWTETSRRYYAEFLVTDDNSVTQRVVVSERAAYAGAAYGAQDAMRATTWYHWRNSNAGRPVLGIAEDGLATRWSYELTGSTRTTESFTAPLSATNGIPYKTTVSRNVANLKGDVQREETWLVTAEGRELLAWTDYERDSAGRVVRSESSNGDIEEAQWGCCGEDWTLDAKSILTEYAYDAQKRRVSSTSGTITTIWSYDLAGNATNVTRYGISGQGAALVESSASCYNDAGRLVWNVGEDGVRTDYLYAVSPEGGEIRTTIRAAGTDCAVTNTVVSYRDGSTKAMYLNGVLKSTEVRTPFASTTYEGTNGIASVRWTRTETDFLGRTVAQSRPGFGDSTLVSSNLYNTVGQLTSTPSLSTRSTRSTRLNSQLYFYNDHNERVASVDDRNFNNVIDWAGPDLISSNDTRYVSLDGAWWRESRQWSIHEDDSAASQLMGVHRSRVTGLGRDALVASAPNATLASESVSIDQRGNATTNRVFRNRASAEEIAWVKYPTSTTPAVTTSTNGLVRSSTSQTGVTTTFAYDAFEREVAQTDGRDNTTQTTYDNFGRVASTIDALGHATTYGYDTLGRQTSVTDPLTNTVTTAYNAEGREISQRGATYPVDYSYDEFGEKIAMTTYRNAGGPGFVPAASAATGGPGFVPAAGDTTTWLRDEATGLVTNKVYADGKGPTYTYTPDGKLATRTWARGIVTTYSYDVNGALTNTVYSDGTPTISLVYNRAGRQIQAIDAAGVTTFLYDDFGSFTNETVVGVAGTNTIERFYDDFGRSLGYSLNGVRQSTLSYDPATGRLVTMEIPSKQSNNPNNQTIKQFSWSYLAGSDLKSSLAYPNGLTASWQYDANNQLLQVCNATPTNVISQYDYAYDAAGRRINVSKSGTAFDHDDSIVYGYNARSELTNAVAAVDSDYRYAYDFDEIGNRESSSERGTNSVYTANNLNQYTAVDDFTPQFDDDGNQTLIKTSTGIWSVTYNGENRPILWSCIQTNNSNNPNNQTILSMSYDRMGRRVTKNAQRFVYDGYLCIKKIEDSTAIHSSLSAVHYSIWDPTEPVATRPLAWNCGTSPAYYTHDGNKNVSEVIAENGDIAAHYEYAPFGAVIAQHGASAASNPWRFSCEYAEDDTATVYYNYRHYEPMAGRWMSRDPIEEDGGLNLYVIVSNASVMTMDSLGQFGIKDAMDSALCLAACYFDFTVDELKDLWNAWTAPEKLPRNVRRAFELEARKQITGSRSVKAISSGEIQKTIKELGYKKLRAKLSKKAGAKAAKVFAPNAVPLVGQFVSAIMSATEAWTGCKCFWKCAISKFF